jgi:uncharacterized SAM-binding protein YcdF (DUF218 family)
MHTSSAHPERTPQALAAKTPALSIGLAAMNDLLMTLGLLSWKPLLGTLVLPPLTLLPLILVGGWLLPKRRLLGWLFLLAGMIGLWGVCTVALGDSLITRLTQPPPALDAAQRAGLVGAPRTAILVLGAGRKFLAPEYDSTDLKPMTLERLRYGLWLGRQTRLPVGYSGGLGYGSTPGQTEAETAQRIAERDFGQRLRWLEDESSDTNENAAYSVPLLRAAGIDTIVLVTHGFHQRRALAAFERALAHEGTRMRLIAAPVGLRRKGELQLGDWLPTNEGFVLTRLALHEWLGRLAGA